MLLNPLANFKIQKYYQNKNVMVFIQEIISQLLQKIRLINLIKYAKTGTHWILTHVEKDKITYFGSFVVEHISI